MAQLAILDAGPLYAVLDTADQWHRDSVTLLSDTTFQFVIPVLVLAEVSHFIQRRLGGDVEAEFAGTLKDWRIEAPLPQDWERIAQLVRTYADWPLGITDASVVVLAERLDTDVVATLDRRHFGAVRPAHCAAFRMVPSPQ
jgi:predicted nucleic acid-binding protein